MADSILRAAVIGAGVGRAHAKGYHSSPDSELVAACDSDPVRLAQFADHKGYPEWYAFTGGWRTRVDCGSSPGRNVSVGG